MIELEKQFDVPAGSLWAIVGTPGRTDWVPGVSQCEFDGELRRMTMEGAGVVVERILSVDDQAMRIEYSVIESAAPLAKHLASIEIQTAGEGTCRMIWKTEVDPEAVEPFIVTQMKASFDQLEAIVS